MRLPFIAVVSAVVFTQDAPPIAKYVPPAPNPAHVFVLDSAHILSAATVAALQDSALALQAATGADVAWVTLPTLGGRAIEEAALYIGRTWHIGSAGQAGDPLRNRGLVVLYIPDKTKTAGSNFRIEVGNGLEGTITDSRSRTITNAMRADLRAKHYDDAYLAGWTVAASLVREDFAASIANAPNPIPLRSSTAQNLSSPLHSVAFTIMMWMIAIVFGILLLLLILSRRRATPGGIVLPASTSNDPPRYTNDDDEQRRQQSSNWFSSSSDSSSSGSSDSSSGGDFGGGGGFSGGGSSDSI